MLTFFENLQRDLNLAQRRPTLLSFKINWELISGENGSKLGFVGAKFEGSKTAVELGFGVSWTHRSRHIWFEVVECARGSCRRSTILASSVWVQIQGEARANLTGHFDVLDGNQVDGKLKFEYLLVGNLLTWHLFSSILVIYLLCDCDMGVGG